MTIFALLVTAFVGAVILEKACKAYHKKRRSGVVDSKYLTGKEQQMLFMSEALDMNVKITQKLARKMDERALEIAKAEKRFLVTPEDVIRAYQELLREEQI